MDAAAGADKVIKVCLGLMTLHADMYASLALTCL